MMTDNTFFDMLKALYSKSTVEYDEKVLNPYLMLMWVSHSKEDFAFVEAISKYLYVVKSKYIWQYLRYKLPYNRSKFLKYIKKDQLDNEDEIKELCEEYGISELEARLFL
jgi:hypothetical protein